MTASATTFSEGSPQMITALTISFYPHKQDSADTFEHLPRRFLSVMLELPMQSFITQEPVMTEISIEEIRQQATEYIELFFDDDAFWLKAAESSFDFWDNESDAYFDTL